MVRLGRICLVLCFLISASAYGAEKNKTVPPGPKNPPSAAPLSVPPQMETKRTTTAEVVIETANDESNRTENHFGFFLSAIEPLPAIIGANLGYNIFDFSRVTVGFSSSSWTTLGFGLNGYVPGWSFSPTVGIHWATISAVGGDEFQGFSGTANHLYLQFGLDWQAESGFNFGAGYNLSLKSGVGGLPYVQIGWFFNWF